MLKAVAKLSSSLALSLVVVGCGSLPALEEIVPDNTQKYRRADTMPPLDVPPDLSTARINDDIAGVQQSAASYSEFEQAAKNPLAARYNIVPESRPVLSGEGEARRLVVPGEREVTWQRIELFWEQNNIDIRRKDFRIGLMDTEADPDGYAYRLRMERGDVTNSARISLIGRDDNNQNAPKNENMIRQLAEFLGVLYQDDVARSEQQRISTSTPRQELPRAVIMDDGSNQQVLLVEQDFSAVWDRVGRVLDSRGFRVEDRDRANGFYFVRYIDPFNEVNRKEKGLLGRMAFWRSEAEQAPEEYYYIKLISDADQTRIIILDAEQVRSESDTARRLLSLIQEQLTQ